MQHTRILMMASWLIAINLVTWATGCDSFYDRCTKGLCGTFKDAGGEEAAAGGGGVTSGGGNRQGKLRAELVSIAHVSGDDPGENVEFFGHVSLRYPTTESGVVSCSEGGAQVDLWRLNDGSWLNMTILTTWQPPSPVFVDINDVPIGAGQALCVQGQIKEEDESTGEFTEDDDFGEEQRLISFESGWAGDHTLHLHGMGENAADVTLHITIE
jgi:hypothetical protein